ncbi:MAG TPA: glutaredoxin family protein [Thermomicrobiales bacterium]|nr:glutaredoxin family protein [Thermomicrobiales bacterium]
MNQPEIIVYARARFSPDAQRTRDRLLELDLSYVEHDIETDVVAGEALEELTGVRRVPTVVIGDRVLIEPSTEELDVALRDAGFTTPPSRREQ